MVAYEIGPLIYVPMTMTKNSLWLSGRSQPWGGRRGVHTNNLALAAIRSRGLETFGIARRRPQRSMRCGASTFVWIVVVVESEAETGGNRETPWKRLAAGVID